MNEYFPVILAGLLSGGVFVAIVEGIREWLSWKRGRKDKKEDREFEKTDKTEKLEQIVKAFQEEEKQIAASDTERFRSIEDRISHLQDGVKFILLDRILYLGERYIEKGEVTIEEKRLLHRMHDVYHFGLSGNGDADIVMDAVDELPVKK